MRFTPFHPLTTSRLLLRRLEKKDAPLFYARLGSSEAVTKNMLWKPHASLAESEESVRRAIARYDSGHFYRWAITEKGEGSIIGIIDLLRFDEEAGTCSFAYMLGEEFWGRGYGTEALKAVLDFAFREMELEAVAADHFAENPASGAVMRKAGMAYTHTIPSLYEKDGHLHNAPQYRITREQWLAEK